MFRVSRLDPEHKNPSSETVLRAGQAAGPSLLALSAWNLHARLEHWNIRVLAVHSGKKRGGMRTKSVNDP